ncbi:MAG: hypothetical protein WBF35_15390 [Candidatus Acidiferrales bacterium]
MNATFEPRLLVVDSSVVASTRPTAGLALPFRAPILLEVLFDKREESVAELLERLKLNGLHNEERRRRRNKPILIASWASETIAG